MLAFYERSEDVVAIQSSGQVRTGIAELRKEYEAGFEEVIFEKVSLEPLSVRESGDVAWATGRFKARTVRRSDKSMWSLTSGGRWMGSDVRDTIESAGCRVSHDPRVRNPKGKIAMVVTSQTE